MALPVGISISSRLVTTQIMTSQHMDANAGTNVLLIVNTAGRLRVVYTPFRVGTSNLKYN
jgi:hypothetical protein